MICTTYRHNLCRYCLKHAEVKPMPSLEGKSVPLQNILCGYPTETMMVRLTKTTTWSGKTICLHSTVYFMDCFEWASKCNEGVFKKNAKLRNKPIILHVFACFAIILVLPSRPIVVSVAWNQELVTEHRVWYEYMKLIYLYCGKYILSKWRSSQYICTQLKQLRKKERCTSIAEVMGSIPV